MNDCGCCSCLSAGPHLPANRPGLSALRYRVGTHNSFLDSMIRRLSSNDLAALRGLRTRETDDPSIALLDGWATVADVLTFYQERIANEGYVRTATERRSLLELGRLVGYRLRPGVAASTYLAYTIDPTAIAQIPAGSKAQSIPGPDEQPQTFETSEDFEARGAWNGLLPRAGRPAQITLDGILTLAELWIGGTSANLRPGDALLFVFSETRDSVQSDVYALRRVQAVYPDFVQSRTRVVLQPVDSFATSAFSAVSEAIRKNAAAAASPQFTRLTYVQVRQAVLLGTPRTAFANYATGNADVDAVLHPPNFIFLPFFFGLTFNYLPFTNVLTQLVTPKATPPANAFDFRTPLDQSFSQESDLAPRLLSALSPELGLQIYSAIAGFASAPISALQSVNVLRTRAALFGYNAPSGVDVHDIGTVTANAIHIDMPVETIVPGTYAVVQPQDDLTRATIVDGAETKPLSRLKVSGKTTRLALRDSLNAESDTAKIRGTSVYAQSEALTVIDIPIDNPVGLPPAGDEKMVNAPGESHTRIPVEGIVEGLAAGRWVVVTGERADLGETRGVIATELAMIAAVEQHINDAGAKPYSVIVLAADGLARWYRRETVRILANVVKATNGDTRGEVLGAGDATQALQTFTLQQPPLTYVAAPTPDGVVSTLAVRVNDVLWHLTDDLVDARPADHVYVTTTADDGKVSLTFGTGVHGARLPTGSDNVRAVYRRGIGKGANVKAGQIATALSRPLGVSAVTNPLPASGGADPESRDDARRNIPVALQALGRVVSLRDYADFARTFAGIAKASAVRLSNGVTQFVHLTIGGVDDIDIDATSDLYVNLVQALSDFGDPYQPFVVALREKLIIAGAAKVRVLPDYLWAVVAPKIRAALIDAFSWEHRQFGQPVYPSDVVSVIQSVEGVSYVDLDDLGAISADDLTDIVTNKTDDAAAKLIEKLKGVKPIVPRLAHPVDNPLPGKPRLFVPAQIAYLPPSVPEVFALTELHHD
jgi:hypothetical protein